MTTFANHTTTARPVADLRAAYKQARARYEADPENPQTARALGWVYANLLKDASGSTDVARMLRGLALIAGFPMPDQPDDSRWQESIGWSVCRFLLRHTPDTLPLGPLAEVISRAEAFVPAKAGLLRSVWWKALLRHAATGIDWLGLVDRHGWAEGFRPEDEAPETYGDGSAAEPRVAERGPARPLLEGLVQAVVKQLLQMVVLPDAVAAPWLDRLADFTARHPDWDYLPYYHARLLLRLDRPTEAMAVYLPFARRKKRDFWVWSLLAELVEPTQVLACYARALSLGTPDMFLVKVRQRAAGLLIRHDRWADARPEIDRLVQTRQANGWPIPAEVQRWLNDDQYTQAGAVPACDWYAPLLAEADSLLWADCPETVALVTGRDGTGQYVNVAIDAQTTGSFPAGKFGLNPAVGYRLALRYVMQEKKGRMQLQVLTATRTDAAPGRLPVRTVSGPLRVLPGKGVGFVGDVYVPAELLAGMATLADALVTVEAIASWDAVKQKSGWRAFRIAKESLNLSV